LLIWVILDLDKDNYLLVMLVAVLISVSVLSVNTKSAYANTAGSDTWGLSPIQTYVDTTISITDCGPNGVNQGGDTDGDGICDNWEDGTHGNGLHIRFSQNGINYSYDLSCNPSTPGDCPSATHKDVYMELDWMQGHAPSSTAINDVVTAYNNAPVQNNDGVNGVHLHIQYGENPSSSDGNTGVHVTLLKVKTALWNTNASPNYGFWVLKENKFGTVVERTTSDPNHNTYCVTNNGASESWHDCGTAKRQVFHYAVFIHQQYESSTSSGWAEIDGNDFVVSLGSFAGGVGSTDDQESAVMHELGHNLGLYHGGGVPPDVNGNGYDLVDDNADNCKPNYLSVMSYTYEFRSTNDVCRPLDYSSSSLNTLNENSLVDSNVGSYKYPNPDPDPPGQTGTCNNVNHNGIERPIWYSNPAKTQATTGSTVDWNANTATPYTQNLNNLGVPGCSSTYKSTLNGHNDWTGIVGPMTYQFTTSALSASGNVTDTAGSSKCDGLSAQPIGHIMLSGLAPSGNSSSLTAQITDIGGATIIKSGLVSAGSGTSNIDKIIVPGVIDMTKDLSKAADSLGATYVPAVGLQPHGEESSPVIPVYSLSNSEGDINEWACYSHQEITLDTVKQFRSQKIESIKFAVDAIPDKSFKNPISDASTLDGYLETAKQSNSLYDLTGVITALQYVKSSANNLIIDPQALEIVNPRIDDALTSFMIANYVVPNTVLYSTPSDPSGSSVSFSFRSDVSGSTFECQLDSGTFSTCTSTQPYSNLSNGQHKFQVRAVANGLTDTTPQTFTWTVSTTPDLLYVIIGYGLAILFGVVIAVAAVFIRKK
jgi:hypothetical protein